jgi:hypothetical protein
MPTSQSVTKETSNVPMTPTDAYLTFLLVGNPRFLGYHWILSVKHWSPLVKHRFHRLILDYHRVPFLASANIFWKLKYNNTISTLASTVDAIGKVLYCIASGTIQIFGYQISHAILKLTNCTQF